MIVHIKKNWLIISILILIGVILISFNKNNKEYVKQDNIIYKTNIINSEKNNNVKTIISEQEIKNPVKDNKPDFNELKKLEFHKKVFDLQESIEDQKEWFIQYKILLEDYSEWIDPPERIEDEYTSDEIYLIQRVVETETYDSDFLSKVNVANVIFNRIYNSKFPNNVSDVITAHNQFSYHKKEISYDTELAVEYAYMIKDTTNGALYFKSGKKSSSFNGASYVFEDTAGHYFYK